MFSDMNNLQPQRQEIYSVKFTITSVSCVDMRAKTGVIKTISSTERDRFSSISSNTNNREFHMKGGGRLRQGSSQNVW